MSDPETTTDPRLEVIALKMAQWDAVKHGWPPTKDLANLEDAGRDHYLGLARIALEGLAP